jgi:hypothetical protein
MSLPTLKNKVSQRTLKITQKYIVNIKTDIPDFKFDEKNSITISSTSQVVSKRTKTKSTDFYLYIDLGKNGRFYDTSFLPDKFIYNDEKCSIKYIIPEWGLEPEPDGAGFIHESLENLYCEIFLTKDQYIVLKQYFNNHYQTNIFYLQ